MKLTLIVFILVSAASTRVAAQAPRIGVDHRVELMAIIFKFAGNPEYNQNRFEPYINDIERQFGPFREHRAVALARDLRETHGTGFDAVMSLAVRLTAPPEMRERVPLDSATNERLPAPEVRRFLEEARRFAADTEAAEFFAAHRALYDSAGVKLQRLLEQQVDLDWFRSFFGGPPAEDFIVVPMLANSGTNFGPSVRPSETRPELYAILGHAGTDSAGFPVYDEGVVGTLVHEFNHSFANPLVDEHLRELEGSAQSVYAVVAEAMREQAYNWRGMLYESLVDAAVARYYRSRQDAEAEQAYLAEQRARSWLWLDELSQLLGEYEADRASYPNLGAFMPRVVAYFDSLPGRVEEMLRRYDASRPRALSLSIENGSEVIASSLQEIVVRFDRPVRSGFGSITAVPGARERFPNLTRQELDPTGTILRLEVQLDPGREYEFRINTAAGNGFRSIENGVPLSPYRIWFRTLPDGQQGFDGAAATP